MNQHHDGESATGNVAEVSKNQGGVKSYERHAIILLPLLIAAWCYGCAAFYVDGFDNAAQTYLNAAGSICLVILFPACLYIWHSTKPLKNP